MMIYVGDLIRLFNESDWHEVIRTFSHNGFPHYELSDGRSVPEANIEAVLQDEPDVATLADNY